MTHCERPLWMLVAVSAAAGTLALNGAAAPAPANDFSWHGAISADGRYVAFTSDASNLVEGDANGRPDVFVRDLAAGTTQLVSRKANDSSWSVAISADGRVVAFSSDASNLVAGDTNGEEDVFVRDRAAGTTERVSVSSAGAQGIAPSEEPAVSADGRFVVFSSYAPDLVAGDTNGTNDVFVRDRVARTTARVNASSGGAQAIHGCELPDVSCETAISADGRFVAFTSDAANLVPGDTNRANDVFVRDLATGSTTRENLSGTGAQANGYSASPALSADGRYLAFNSIASNLVPGDTNGASDVFVRDRLTGATERVNVSGDGAQARGAFPSADPTISADGRFVAFYSYATNLVPGDTNGRPDIFVRDREARTTQRVAVSARAQRDGDSDEPSLSANGRFLAFTHNVEGGTVPNVFVRDRAAGTTKLVSVGRAFAPKAGRLALRPWPARAGGTLTVTLPVLAGGSGVADARVACTATAGGRRLTPVFRGFDASTARCVWRVPGTARGKRLAGSISAATVGGTATRRFAAKVR